MTDISKVTQETSAQDYYKSVYYSTLKSDVIAAKKMVSVCDSIKASIESLIEDQTERCSEIEVSYNEISNLQKETECKVKKLEKKYEALLAKREKGTLNESEENELGTILGQIDELNNSANAQIKTKNAEIETQIDKNTDVSSKIFTANNYGKFAVEKGEDLANTQDKRKTFFRKLFHNWSRAKIRKAGEELNTAGNDLLEKAETSKTMEKVLSSKTKKTV